MATDVSICSNALLRLGADPINSFDEADQTGSNIERARIAANLWPTVRQGVLRAHPWNCALKRVVLSPDLTPPAFGFANRFLFPADWLRTIQVGQYETDRIAYRTESRTWVTDEVSLYLVYVYDNDDPTTYDASLVNALELAMTAALAYPITRSSAAHDSFTNDFLGAIKSARAMDGQDDPPETLGDFPLMQSRFYSPIAPP